MTDGVKAIDCMYYVATRAFIDRWNRAKEGELICRMERAIGGLPAYDSIEEMIRQMDEAGVERVFIAQCKMWSYWRKWMYMDTQLEEVLQYTQRYPDRFVGLAGYNPYRITESLREIEIAVKQYGFKGVYVHIYGFDIPLHDRKMYPLYAKCVELDVPVSLQVGHVLEAMPSDCGRPIYLDRVACDFPELKIVGAHTGWPWVGSETQAPAGERPQALQARRDALERFVGARCGLRGGGHERTRVHGKSGARHGRGARDRSRHRTRVCGSGRQRRSRRHSAGGGRSGGARDS